MQIMFELLLKRFKLWGETGKPKENPCIQESMYIHAPTVTQAHDKTPEAVRCHLFMY